MSFDNLLVQRESGVAVPTVQRPAFLHLIRRRDRAFLEKRKPEFKGK